MDVAEQSSIRGGDGEQSTLQMDRSQDSQGLPCMVDISRKAEKFDTSLLPKLNSAMRKFTLTGKVAVITG